MTPLCEHLLQLAPAVRYVAVYDHGTLTTRSRDDTTHASSAESDRYEELIVNPTVLTLTTQRGGIDCGGLFYVVIRYGHFFQVVIPRPAGHVSVCVEAAADPIAIATRVLAALDEWPS